MIDKGQRGHRLGSSESRRGRAARSKSSRRKVFELYNGGSQVGVMHRQLEKARRRDENNRRKRELVEVRAAELPKRYSEIEQRWRPRWLGGPRPSRPSSTT